MPAMHLYVVDYSCLTASCQGTSNPINRLRVDGSPNTHCFISGTGTYFKTGVFDIQMSCSDGTFDLFCWSLIIDFILVLRCRAEQAKSKQRARNRTDNSLTEAPVLITCRYKKRAECKKGKSFSLSRPDGHQKTNKRCCTGCRRSFAHEANNPVKLQSLRRKEFQVCIRSLREAAETLTHKPAAGQFKAAMETVGKLQKTNHQQTPPPPCSGPIPTAQYSQSISLNIIGFLSLTVKKCRRICIQI